MADIEPGQVWEMYSQDAKGWVRVVVTHIADRHVKLRYEGVLEFVTVELEDMMNKPDEFRPAPP